MIAAAGGCVNLPSRVRSSQLPMHFGGRNKPPNNPDLYTQLSVASPCQFTMHATGIIYLSRHLRQAVFAQMAQISEALVL